jgi:CHAT domain-containing protein
MVLLDLLEVKEKDGASTLHYSVWTREALHFEVRSLPDRSGGTMRVGDVVIPRSALAEQVKSTRASVNLDPRGELVSPEGTDDLTFMGDFLLGPIWKQLTKHRTSGKKHLCIVPHGPLHYLPFQLLIVGGKPLCDHWNISYLPNTRMLLGNRGLQAVRRHRTKGAAAMGLSFRGTPAHLPEAVPEARDVATLSGGRAYQERDATEAVVLQALRSSRMVHIATHGDLTSGAAAFQRLYLAPSGNDDGLLHAHELLGVDARGLQLVTLSACGTALGRFDTGDNLRGLLANLFLAGAETVVGTLWDLESTAASTFFRAMYRALEGGATRFDAFGQALGATRQAHPSYRDWGTFYYSGNWA